MLYEMDSRPEDVLVANREWHPTVRQLSIAMITAETPQTDINRRDKTAWVIATEPQQVAEFSAVGYHFATTLGEKLNIPVGIIRLAYGGAPGGSFVKRELLDRWPGYEHVHQRWEKTESDFAKAQDRFRAAQKKFEAGLLSKLPKEPRIKKLNRPAGIYNGMIHPFFPFEVEGVLYYQGESDVRNPEQYDETLRDLMASWREGWRQPELPFFIVQLPRFGSSVNWAPLRHAQWLACEADPNAHLSVQIDQGESGDIHPGRKHIIGERLAEQVAREFYRVGGQRVPPTPPRMQTAGTAMLCRFEQPLIVHPHDDRSANFLPHFEVAGADGIFHPAAAHLLNASTIRVSAPTIRKPVQVRYAWSSDPRPVVLFAQNGLPVPPFSIRGNDE